MVVGIEITVIAIVYVMFSVYVQRRLIDMKHMQEVQETIKQKSKELNEMSKNKASQEVLLAKQKEITSLLSKSMSSQLKPMFVVLPIFFVVYYLVFPAVFTTNPNITVPILAWTLNYKSYFIMVAFVVGLALSMGLMLRDRIRFAKEKKQAETIQQ
ncbi:MAG: DUF106 domain-containing protein [Candidatus Micrarchaeota archaeon]|nr:DUF106 domain-containing protein [Candidatus Micrarchaeota archaeon]